MDRKLLTPAEAVLLLEPKGATAIKCVQAGLLSLLGADRIAFEPSGNPFKQTALLLHPQRPSDAVTLPEHLVSLERALIDTGRARLVSSQVLQALQKRFGYGFGRYVHEEVAPGLIKRGLLTRTDRKLLGIFPRVSYQRSPRGDALGRPLERLLLAIEQLPSLIASDPDRAMRLVRSAGVLLVMSPRARRQIPKLRKLFENRSADLAPMTHLTIDDGDEPEWDNLLELGEIALEFDVSALLDGLASVGDFTSGGDNSSSDGGGGGD